MSAKENINSQRKRPNEYCRVCKKSLRLTYGRQLSFKSYLNRTNLFKPSQRKESFAEVIADFGAISIVLTSSLQLVCDKATKSG